MNTMPQDAAPWWVDAKHPTWRAFLLVLGPVSVTVVLGLLGAVLLPGVDQMVLRLVAVLVVMVAALTIVSRDGAWRRIGAAGGTTWVHTWLLVVPALVALAPLVTGISLPPTGTLGVLVLGYAATGVFEEIWHRGVVLDALRNFGLRRSALIGGALFAASHLANVAFGQNVAVSLAQAVGAFCFGIGFSIFRWRTNAVWLLVVIHAVGDLMFKITGLSGGLLWGFLIGHDTLMLLWGLWCLRGARDDVRIGRAAAP